MPKCSRCNETAPSNPPCPHTLCGKCCDLAPPCSADVHKKPRRKVRGCVGKQASARKEAAWKEAKSRCRHLWRAGRTKTLSRVLGVSPIAIRIAILKALLHEARGKLGRYQPQLTPTAEPADTAVELSVALLVPATSEAEVVRGMINSDTMQEMLEEEWDGEATGFYPDWGGSDHDDEGAGAVLTQGSSASSWLGPETPSEPSPAAPSAVPAATQLSAAAPPPRGATGSTTLAAVDVTTAVVDVGSEVGRPQDEKPWLVVNSQGHPCAHWERRSPPLADSLATFDEGGFRYDVPRGEFRVATLVSLGVGFRKYHDRHP